MAASRRDVDDTAFPHRLTEEVVTSFAASPNIRLRELMQSLVRHMHAFALDVQLTQSEWASAIDFLTRTGQMCSPTRQEFILLSDVLGLSMLTVNIGNPTLDGVTASTVFGPFFVENSPLIPHGGTIAEGVAGVPCYVSGTVRSTDGAPVADARVDVWEADGDGFYDVQYSHGRLAGRGHLLTDINGNYAFWSVLPQAYPIPDDGPVGELLSATGRSPMRPAHLHFMVDAAEHRRLITHIFVADSEHLSSDAVFGVTDSLIAPFRKNEAGLAPDGTTTAAPWYSVEYDFTLRADS